MLLNTFFAFEFLASSVIATPALRHRIKRQSDSDVDSFIASESPIAYQGVLNNIGSAGAGASGASAGVVVASPSKTDPDCEYFPASSPFGYYNSVTY
jgi:glucoamylase